MTSAGGVRLSKLLKINVFPILDVILGLVPRI